MNLKRAVIAGIDIGNTGENQHKYGYEKGNQHSAPECRKLDSALLESRRVNRQGKNPTEDATETIYPDCDEG